jgi:hypothetical protein
VTERLPVAPTGRKPHDVATRRSGAAQSVGGAVRSASII